MDPTILACELISLRELENALEYGILTYDEFQSMIPYFLQGGIK